jgi:hypothetical protein
VFALLPVPGASREAMKTIRADLAGPPPVSVRHQFYEVARTYLGGLLDVRLGDLTTADQMLTKLRAYRGSESATRTAQWYARILNAELLRTKGSPGEALAALGEPAQVPEGRRAYIWSYAKAQERLLRAELLDALGRRTDAVRWYATFPDVTGYDVAFIPSVRLAEARAREALGDRNGAALSYLKFITMWSQADKEFGALGSRARASFEHLGR